MLFVLINWIDAASKDTEPIHRTKASYKDSSDASKALFPSVGTRHLNLVNVPKGHTKVPSTHPSWASSAFVEPIAFWLACGVADECVDAYRSAQPRGFCRISS